MLKIRLRRMGAIRQPHYRIVVADARAPRDGAFVEILGHYNPRTEPATIMVDVAKYDDWKQKGAQPTDAVARLVRQFNRQARAAAVTDAPAADRRTRTASGKGITKAAPVAPTEPAAEAEAAEPMAAAAAPVEPPTEPVLEAASSEVPAETLVEAAAEVPAEDTAEAAPEVPTEAGVDAAAVEPAEDETAAETAG